LGPSRKDSEENLYDYQNGVIYGPKNYKAKTPSTVT